jgi:GntR family transcriptional regulator
MIDNTSAEPVKRNKRRGVSLQERIYRVLEERLQAGDFAPGAALPSEDALAVRFSVSRVTVRAALARLEQDGRIKRIQGRGTLVTAAPMRSVRLSLGDVLSDMDNVARATSVRVLAFNYRPAPAEVAAMLGLAGEAIFQHAVRLRSENGRVLLHLTTYIPEAIGLLWTVDELASTPLQVLLKRNGIFPAAGQQVVTAGMAGPEVAERLGVAMGDPLLRVQRTYVDASGRPIEYIEILGPAGSFELRMALRGRGLLDEAASDQ